MKTILKILVALFFISWINEEIKIDNLIGIWQMTETNYNNEMVITPKDLGKETFYNFKANGLLENTIYFSDFNTVHEFNWIFQNNKLLIIDEKNDTVEHQIIDLSDSLLILKFPVEVDTVIMKMVKKASR